MNMLAYLRARRGLNQRRFSEISGLSTWVLSRMERGWFAKPPSGALEAIQRVYGPQWTWEALMSPPPEIPAPADRKVTEAAA